MLRHLAAVLSMKSLVSIMSPKCHSAKSLIEKTKVTLRDAEANLKDALNAFSQFAQTMRSESTDDPLDFHTVQLLLQYRLNNQDALRGLFLCQQSIWQILGISPANSMEVNYERLAFALGSDDLHRALSMLNQLSVALLKLIDKLQHKVAAREHKLDRSLKRKREQSVVKVVGVTYDNKRDLSLQNAIKNQNQFKLNLTQLIASLELIAGAPTIGEELNEVAAFQGPISRYYQSVINGMELSDGLTQELKPIEQMTPNLTELMKQAHDTLALTATALDHQSFFAHHAPTVAPSSPVEKPDLEEQAAKIRLGNFFH